MANLFTSILTTRGSGGGNYKEATITITCDPEFAGKTIYCIKDEVSYQKKCPSSNPYIVTFDIDSGGEWTISATIDEKEYTTTAIVDLDFDLEFGFNWRTWVNTAKYLDSADYSTLSDLLKDEEAIRELCLEHNCVDYLCDSEEANDDLETIIKNDLFAKWVNNSDYALDNMLENTIIKEMMDASEVKLVAAVPTMTSNTTPSGVASASSYYNSQGGTNYAPYKAFNGSITTTVTNWWFPEINDVGNYLKYQFVSPVCAKKLQLYLGSYAYTPGQATFVVSASNDDSTYTEIGTITATDLVTTATHTVTTYDVDLENDATYLYYKITCNSVMTITANNLVAIAEAQFYTEEYSSKYGYGEWALVGQVPTMTSNTAPYGTASASSVQSGYEAYKAFDSDSSTGWLTSSVYTNAYIQYDFINPVCVKKVFLRDYGSSVRTKNFKVQGSNDGFVSDTHDIYTGQKDNILSDSFSFENDGFYKSYRLLVIDNYTSGASIGLAELQFYAYAPKGNVPVMTSNTAPYGVASATSARNTTYAAYCSFNDDRSAYWIAGTSVAINASSVGSLDYKFTNPICVKRFLFEGMTAVFPTTELVLNGSNDGSTFTPIQTYTSEDLGDGFQRYYFDVDNDSYYLYYRLSVKQTNKYNVATDIPRVMRLQYYGRELKDLVPPMISNTLPSGECFASSNHSSSNSYFAFDKTDDVWVPLAGSTNNYIGYEFDNVFPVLMATVKFSRFATTGKTMPAKSFTLQASDDGLTYGSALATFNVPAVTASTAVSEFTVSFAEQNKKYFELACADSIYITGTGNISVRELQLFGKDYSEKEFEVGTIKKWLYDHGLELETANTPYGGGSNTYINYESSRLVFGITDGSSLIIPNWSVDFTSYNLARAKITNNYNVDKNDLRAMNSSGIYIGGLVFTTALLPNNLGYDVSSINQDGKLGICVQGSTNANTNGHTELAELWLE